MSNTTLRHQNIFNHTQLLPAVTAKVRIWKMPKLITYTDIIDKNTTVQEALEKAGVDHSGYEIRVNNQKCYPDLILSSGETIMLLKNIEGN